MPSFIINGFGQLQISSANGIETGYEYDNLSRVRSKTQIIDSQNHTYTFDFNIFGKTKKITYPSGFAVNYHYKNGYFSTVELLTTRKLAPIVLTIN